jgi:L-threonylcarbamoyladenylate synthase
MQTLVLPADQPDAIPKALELLQKGALVAFPTDTVYGLGADAHNPQAIERLYQAKGREASKAIAILIGSMADLAQVARHMPEVAQRLVEAFWPGPLTVIVERLPDLPENLSPLPTIGVRMPDHPVALALLNASGPLAVTSANLSNAPNTTSSEEVLDQLGGRIRLILDGGRTSGGVPSTVVDCTQPELRILRPGPINADEITHLWYAN